MILHLLGITAFIYVIFNPQKTSLYLPLTIIYGLTAINYMLDLNINMAIISTIGTILCLIAHFRCINFNKKQ